MTSSRTFSKHDLVRFMPLIWREANRIMKEVKEHAAVTVFTLGTSKMLDEGYDPKKMIRLILDAADIASNLKIERAMGIATEKPDLKN